MDREFGSRGAWGGWLAVCLVATVMGAMGASTPRGAAATARPAARGGELYQRWCAVCHATDGSGTVDGPSLHDVSVAYLDLTMRTGRMPLSDPLRGVRGRRFTDAERRAVVEYVADRMDLDGQVPEVAAGSASSGRQVYGTHCAACHGASGGGGLAGDGTPIPPIVGADPVAIAEATRVGPFEMPRFGETVITDDEVDDVAAFLDERTHRPVTPLGYPNTSRALAAGFAAALTAVALWLCVWASRRPRTGQDDDGDA